MEKLIINQQTVENVKVAEEKEKKLIHRHAKKQQAKS